MFLPLFSRKAPAQQFLSLVIGEATVAAALWSVSEVGPKVIKTSAPVEWNSDAEASLIEASDVALEDLGSQANTTKDVLLGLPESWATSQSIASDKKHLLKKLTDQLNLKSVGFVITQEAIAALFRDREHTGCNALLILVGQKNVSFLSILHGKASDSVSVGRSDSLVKDMLEGCARGSFSALPARILLASQDLSETDMNAMEHELSAYVFDEQLFIHAPRVEVVSTHVILEAVSVAGGKEVARALGILKPDSVPMDSGTTDGQGRETDKNESFGFAPVEVGEVVNPDAPLDFGIDEPLPSRFPIKKIAIALCISALSICVIGGVAYAALSTLTKVTVAVTIKTQPVSFDSVMTIDANASATDANNNILKAALRTKDVTDTIEAITTGSKIIGDKATGTVTIYNRNAVGDKVFKAGTVLKLDDKVSYTLDADTTVPVGTKDSNPPFQGAATAKVTAINIGAESNVADKTELTVAGFDKGSFVALTNGAFSGGTSRTIQVVSDADQKQLGDKLFASLKDQALAAFNKEANPTEHIILSDKVVVSKKTFSDDIGKEVKSFTLTMTVTATAIVYTNDDISTFATAKLGQQIPAGAVLKPDRTVIEITSSQAISDTKTIVKSKISSVVIPAFDGQQIAGVLAGKTVDDASSFLQSQHAISSYLLQFSPSFAKQVVRRMPTQSARIHVQTTVE